MIFDRSLRAAGRGLFLLGSTLSVALISAPASVRADVAEYWSRETFKSERVEIVSSLSEADSTPTATPPVVPRSTPRPARTRSAQPATRPKSVARPKVRVASLGAVDAPAAEPAPSLSGGGGVRWRANAACLKAPLRGVIAQVAARFGSVTVTSTCRSRRHNARVGGARNSLHLTGDAADLRVHGNWGAAGRFMRGLVGGYKHYGGGLFHIDTGSRRTW